MSWPRRRQCNRLRWLCPRDVPVAELTRRQITPLDVIRAAPMQLDIHDSLNVGVALVQGSIVDGVLTCDQAITSSEFVPV